MLLKIAGEKILFDAAPLYHLTIFFDLEIFKKETKTYFKSYRKAITNLYLLKEMLDSCDVYTTEGTLTEVFDIIEKRFEDLKLFGVNILNKVKIYKKIPRREDVISYGYNDAVILRAADDGFLIITSDKDLCNEIISRGKKAILYPFHL